MASDNLLYFGDNLDVLNRHVKDESVDLVYLDPPFNSNRDYNLIFAEKDGTRPAAQIKAFTDTWEWGQETARIVEELVETGGEVSRVMQAFRTFLGTSDALAYLTMMAPRLVELRRVLKPTGSIYLHCDPTASHYLKMLMDAVFGKENYLNEIIWHYRKWPSGKYGFQRNHDVLLCYSRTRTRHRTFNQLFMARAPSTLKRFGTAKIKSGYDESGRRMPSQIGDEESEGVRQDDVWDIPRVPPIKQLFPTQKPEALLERIILASSNEGDTILDPFCGCGTAVVVAQALNRRWIGIDITSLAITLIKHRLSSVATEKLDYRVIGEPVSIADAAVLARDDPYQFQWWALGLVGARPVDEKKGKDRGIDGRLYFHDDNGGSTKQIILSVKSGQVGVRDVRDLRGVVDREHAQIGVLITFQPPTPAMRVEAAEAGFYDAPGWGAKYPRLQVLTVADLLGGKHIANPPYHANVTFKKAKGRTRRASTLDLALDHIDAEGTR